MFIEENSKPREKLKAWYLFTDDFIAGTAHLTNTHIGCYVRLLCWNWNKRCQGIPNNRFTYHRIAMCVTQEEKLACDDVIKEFFVELNGIYQNERQLQEYLYITNRREASRQNGKLGGRPKKPSQNPPTPTPTPTSTSKSSSKYSRLFSLFWENINNKVSKGTAEKNFLRIEQEWQDKPEELAKLYNSYYDSIKEKEYAKQPAFWLSAKKYLDKLPEKKYDFGVVNRDEERVKMFVDAIKDNKVTQFIKDYALRNKDIIDMGIRKGLITKEQAINDLEMRNEYL